MIINIRGTNGSGKSTLVRTLLGEDREEIGLVFQPAPTKKDPDRKKWVKGAKGNGYVAVGPYNDLTSGLDRVYGFELQFQAILEARDRYPDQHILCEGILASTTFGSWGPFFRNLVRPMDGSKPTPVLVAYLDTPLDVCLERIKIRQDASPRAARDIKVDLVKHKLKYIESSRRKFRAIDVPTTVLRHEHAAEDLLAAIGESQ